jgi:hypothetical protein
VHKGQNNPPPPPPRVIGVTDKEFPSGPALVEFRGAWEGGGGCHREGERQEYWHGNLKTTRMLNAEISFVGSTFDEKAQSISTSVPGLTQLDESSVAGTVNY